MRTIILLLSRGVSSTEKPFAKPVLAYWYVHSLHPFLSCLFASIGLLAAGETLAQDVLLGLTSIGGVQSVGTAFSIKSTGADFSVKKSFTLSPAAPTGDLIRGGDSYFYGMTSEGGEGTDGTTNAGTIFKLVPNGALTVLCYLNFATTGGTPRGSLVRGSDGNFYGMAQLGGTYNYGTIFKITATGTLTVLRHLNAATDGSYPQGNLVQGSDGSFYGMTANGGAKGSGTIFKITSTGTFSVLRHFLNNTTDGGIPYGSLVRGSDGNFYGLTYGGGTTGSGTVFRMTPAGTYTVLRHLNYTVDGGFPAGSLVQGSDGGFYGMTSSGGTHERGTIFKVTSTGTFTVLRHLDPVTDGGRPSGSLVQGNDGSFYGTTYQEGTYSSGTVFKITSTGTFTVLRHLNAPADGGNPLGSLLLGRDGDFYGMTSGGGIGGKGTIFRISPTGTFTAFRKFPEPSYVNNPYGGLIQGKDGYFYGMTQSGGAYNKGGVFRICNSNFSVLRSFNGTTTGATPHGNLVQGSDGNFYGMTYHGGNNRMGTIFKMTPTGTLTVLRHLNSPADGAHPRGSLVQGSDGNFYGMTESGGNYDLGTIFKITATGTFTVLRHLDGLGGFPRGNLVQGSDGNFYGMTYNGGAYGAGTIFKITPAGTFGVICHLNATTGSGPYGSLTPGTDGNFYGMTGEGGSHGYGTIFKITPAGTLTVLRHFNLPLDGGFPWGSLVRGSNGDFYGMNQHGGSYNAGTIFKMTPTGTFTVLRHFNAATDGGYPLGSLIVQKASPVTTAQRVTTPEDTPKTVTLGSSGGTSLTYTIVRAPVNGALSGSGATRTYTPKANFSGSDSFTFTTTWGCQTSLPATINIAVTSINDAPVLATIGNKRVTSGTPLRFTATATDVDAGQTKTFALVNAPAGASIGAATGAFCWTPATTGTYHFSISVTDNGSPFLSDSETVTVAVAAPALARFAASTEGEEELAISLYPNPVIDKLTVLVARAHPLKATSISDATGKVQFINQHKWVEEQQLAAQLQLPGRLQLQVDVSSLPPGLYLLQLQFEQGEQVLKFVKQ